VSDMASDSDADAPETSHDSGSSYHGTCPDNPSSGGDANDGHDADSDKENSPCVERAAKVCTARQHDWNEDPVNGRHTGSTCSILRA
jgi:hypothetical protein